MNKQQIMVGLVLVAIIAGGAGYMAGKSVGDAALIAKLDEAKKEFAPTPDSNFISGKVKAINGQTITLDTPPTNLFDESPGERRVTVTSSTKIVKLEGQSLSFTEKEIPLSDIKAGDQIDVEAAGLIRTEEEFEATKIIWHPLIEASVEADDSEPAPGFRIPSQ